MTTKQQDRAREVLAMLAGYEISSADVEQNCSVWARYAIAAAIQLADEARLAERAAIVAYLREQSDLGADHGIACDKGTTKRAAFGGGSLALTRVAYNIAAGGFATAIRKVQP